MAHTISPRVRNIVDKLSPDVTPEEAVVHFWDRCAPGTRDSMGDAQAETLERQVRQHHKANQRRAMEVQTDY